MPAQRIVGLLTWNDEKIAIGEAAAAVKINLLLLEPQRAGIFRVRIGVEIRDACDVDAQSAEDA